MREKGYRNSRSDNDRVGDVIGLLRYTNQKFVIAKLDDCLGSELVLGPIQYCDLKFADLVEFIDEPVYSIEVAYIEEEDLTSYPSEPNSTAYLKITYCDPQRDWD